MRLGLGPGTEDKYSFGQTSGNDRFRLAQSILLTVEIDQQNHESVRRVIHVTDMIRPELSQDLIPAACHREYVHLSNLEKLHVKAGGQLAVGVVFRKYKDVWLILIDHLAQGRRG